METSLLGFGSDIDIDTVAESKSPLSGSCVDAKLATRQAWTIPNHGNVPSIDIFFYRTGVKKSRNVPSIVFKFDRRVKYPASAGVMSSAICSDVDMDQGNESEATGKNKAFLFDLRSSTKAWPRFSSE
jgi:hypothetical protein